MKEHPIIFSTEMVKAILDNRKTMTRRVIKPQPSGYFCDFNGLGDAVFTKDEVKYEERHCRFEIGSRLWVREAWRISAWDWEENSADIKYKADNSILSCEIPDDDESTWLIKQVDWFGAQKGVEYIRREDEVEDTWGDYDGRWVVKDESQIGWKSPIFMPRWASRITLEITNIRVERLQDISNEDVIAEGLNPKSKEAQTVINKYSKEPCFMWNTIYPTAAREQFSLGWNKINGTREGCSWSDNPFVFVIEFKKVEAE